MSTVSQGIGTQLRTVEHFDVLIVGAGISGIGSAVHLQDQCPDRSYVVLEALDGYGGTWKTHQYPGIRSDSDLYTFGYRFKPWTGAPIASANEIQKYLGEVITENHLDDHIRYQHRIDSAAWSSESNLWTLNVVRTESGEVSTFTTNFLWMCQGYYRHATGYTPDWKGLDQYRGRVVHPQSWPANLDLSDKQVVVIGSGATAATLVPAIADECEHVTILQRSPTYFYSGENRIELADQLRELEIPEEWIHEICRRKNLQELHALTSVSFEESEMMRDVLIDAVRVQLPEGYDVETHFTPKYRPWRQRIAFIPEGDLFKGISSGQASMVTDEIDCFTEKGILLQSGDELVADVIITATGFNLSVLGDIDFTVDGKPLDLAEKVTYRGMMFTDVPNLVWIFGYFRASWTLRVDLIGDFVCRMLKLMKSRGATSVTPQLRPEDRDDPVVSWIDPENFNPGYLMRSMNLLPKRLEKPEWQHTQDYWVEREDLPKADLDDGCLHFQ